MSPGSAIPPGPSAPFCKDHDNRLFPTRESVPGQLQPPNDTAKRPIPEGSTHIPTSTLQGVKPSAPLRHPPMWLSSGEEASSVADILASILEYADKQTLSLCMRVSKRFPPPSLAPCYTVKSIFGPVPISKVFSPEPKGKLLSLLPPVLQMSHGLADQQTDLDGKAPLSGKGLLLSHVQKLTITHTEYPHCYRYRLHGHLLSAMTDLHIIGHCPYALLPWGNGCPLLVQLNPTKLTLTNCTIYPVWDHDAEGARAAIWNFQAYSIPNSHPGCPVPDLWHPTHLQTIVYERGACLGIISPCPLNELILRTLTVLIPPSVSLLIPRIPKFEIYFDPWTVLQSSNTEFFEESALRMARISLLLDYVVQEEARIQIFGTEYAGWWFQGEQAPRTVPSLIEFALKFSITHIYHLSRIEMTFRFAEEYERRALVGRSTAEILADRNGLKYILGPVIGEASYLENQCQDPTPDKVMSTISRRRTEMETAFDFTSQQLQTLVREVSYWKPLATLSPASFGFTSITNLVVLLDTCSREADSATGLREIDPDLALQMGLLVRAVGKLITERRRQEVRREMGPLTAGSAGLTCMRL